jgi:hypothetical protein
MGTQIKSHPECKDKKKHKRMKESDPEIQINRITLKWI